jgi:hypothetical protein
MGNVVLVLLGLLWLWISWYTKVLQFPGGARTMALLTRGKDVVVNHDISSSHTLKSLFRCRELEVD